MIAHISTSKAHQTDTLATIQLASRIHRLRRRRFKIGHPCQVDDDYRSPVESVDPSSSEQSADTVIYLGPGETETDGEHPPIYMSRLLPSSPQRSISKNSSRSTKSSPCRSKSKPVLDGGEEQWVDGPKISKSKLVEARNHLLHKDKRGQKEMWVDGPNGVGCGTMDFSKRSMIRQWVENQTLQAQTRRRDKTKYRELTVFKTCEDRGRASGQEDSAEEEVPVTATATETPATARNGELSRVVPIQRLQAVGEDSITTLDKSINDNNEVEIELDVEDDIDQESDTSLSKKEELLDCDEDLMTDDDDEIIIVEESTELVPMQDSCLQVTEEDIALSMGELENPLPEVDQDDHPLRMLSDENLSVMSSLGEQCRMERWQSLSDLGPPEDDTASILSEPLYYSDGVYCQNCRLNMTPSRNHFHLNSLSRLSRSISLLRHPDGSSNPNLSALDDSWNKSNELDIGQDDKLKDEMDVLSVPPLPPLQSTMISLSSAGLKCSGRGTKTFLRQMNHSGNIHDPGGRDWHCKRLQQLRQEQRHLIQQIESANKQLNNSVQQHPTTPTWMIRKYSMHESWLARDRAS